MTAAPTVGPDDAVELLERALGYTRVMLADVGSTNLRAPTPCAGWDLTRLLDHMDDALDAFTEAASGHVDVAAAPTTAPPVQRLRDKACALLGAWTEARSHEVVVGDRRLESSVLIAMAALEIAVHGWDVAQATGRGAPIPEDLADALLPIATSTVKSADRGSRFAAPWHLPATPSRSEDLLAFLGRRTGPLGSNRSDPPSRGPIAS